MECIQWCDSNRPVCLSERSGYLWCTFVHAQYTAKCPALWVLEVLCCLYTDTVSVKQITARYVDGCLSKLVDVVSGVRQGNVFDKLLILLYTSKLFSILENKLISYGDDSTVMAVVPSPVVRVTVAETFIRELGRVSEWCERWGMKLNASKTKTMIVSRMHPQSPQINNCGTVLKESDDLVILGMTFDSKMTFEKLFARFPEQFLKDLVS